MIARLFNLSGPYINKHQAYALAQFILDAQAGRPVEVRAPKPVYRSFVSIRELMSLAFALLGQSTSGVTRFDSGGEVLELGVIHGVVEKSGAWYIYNGDRLGQVLVNLLHNAVKFSPRGGTVTVRMSAEGRDAGLFVTVQVLDQGAGVPAEDRGRIFETFEQTSEGRAMGGAGLGLAIVRELVVGDGKGFATAKVDGFATISSLKRDGNAVSISFDPEHDTPEVLATLGDDVVIVPTLATSSPAA